MTMRTPSRELGLRAANLLIDLIDGKQPSETKRLLGAEIIARSSVTEPRKTLSLAQKITASRQKRFEPEYFGPSILAQVFSALA
jgi:hypothetical protein